MIRLVAFQVSSGQKEFWRALYLISEILSLQFVLSWSIVAVNCSEVSRSAQVWLSVRSPISIAHKLHGMGDKHNHTAHAM